MVFYEKYQEEFLENLDNILEKMVEQSMHFFFLKTLVFAAISVAIPEKFSTGESVKKNKKCPHEFLMDF